MKKLHRAVCLFLAILLVTLAVPAAAAPLYGMLPQGQTYGLDNLTNDPGNLTVAFFGCSITQGVGAPSGLGYSTLVYKNYFLQQFPKRTIKFANEAVGSTDTTLGLFRLSGEIASQSPDIVFIEFAVNDAVYHLNLAQSKQNMEAMVRQLLKLPKQPVVVFLYSAFLDYNMVAQYSAQFTQIANYYGIGVIDFNAYVRDRQAAGKIKWQPDWSDDGTHPNQAGHQAYADYIASQLTANPGAYYKKMTMQTAPLTGYEYGNPQLVPFNAATYTGTWSTGVKPGSENGYPPLVYQTQQGGATFTFDFTGRTIGLCALQGSIGSSAAYSIDNGQYTGVINNYVADTRPCLSGYVTFFRNDLPPGGHEIKITVNRPTSQGGQTQNIFAFGYFLTDNTNLFTQAGAFSFDSDAYTNQNAVTATFSLTNLEKTAQKARPILALYKHSGNRNVLVKTVMSDLVMIPPISGVTAGTLSQSLTIDNLPDNTNNEYFIKAFTFNDVLNPLARPFVMDAAGAK